MPHHVTPPVRRPFHPSGFPDLALGRPPHRTSILTAQYFPAVPHFESQIPIATVYSRHSRAQLLTPQRRWPAGNIACIVIVKLRRVDDSQPPPLRQDGPSFITPQRLEEVLHRPESLCQSRDQSNPSLQSDFSFLVYIDGHAHSASSRGSGNPQ